jgi:hypothetical protein
MARSWPGDAMRKLDHFVVPALRLTFVECLKLANMVPAGIARGGLARWRRPKRRSALGANRTRRDSGNCVNDPKELLAGLLKRDSLTSAIEQCRRPG